MNINLPRSRSQSEFIQFKGGLDIVSPPIQIPPGLIRAGQNYEEDIYGGYVSIKGYERYDGQTAPSSAYFYVLPFSNAGTVAIGSTLTGITSAAHGVVIAITATSFILTKVAGTFVMESASSGSSVIGPAVRNGASGDLGAQYTNLAADVYRADIAAVPGSGNILGVAYYKGIVYAFRNNAGATAVGMYKTTSSGWSAVALGFEVYYSAASGTAPVEGATITKGGVSAVLARITIELGSFGAGTAVGRLIFASITAGPFTAGAFTGGIAATCVSQATITIPNIGGRFEFYKANFKGSYDTTYLYGADGANRAFEFDGTTFVPINTGLGVRDKPLHIIAHANHLFISVYGSVMHSAIGDPYNWTTILGAGEITVSDTITGFITQPGSQTSSALAILCRNRTQILYGTSAADWQLVPINIDGGAIAYTIQRIGQTYVFDDRGVTSIAASQNFGNFEESTVSQRVQTWLHTKRNQVTDSHVSRDKQQYRLFFSDGSAAYWTIATKSVAMMPILLANPALVTLSEEVYGGGAEVSFFGSSNGFVYQMERGTSFDGDPIQAYVQFVFDNLKSYRFIKRYQHISFELVGTGYAEFSFSYELGYADSDVEQSDIITNVIDLASPMWDVFIWDAFTWDGKPLTVVSNSINGIAENISIKLQSQSDHFTPLKFSGAFLEFIPLRKKQ